MPGPIDTGAGRTIIILGMHRSGTSCLAGSLQAAGLYLGDVVEQAPRNAKGNREHLTVRAINNAVLEDSGGSWFKPPNEIRWSASRKLERDKIVRSFPDDRAWGFKDPRTLLTIDGWLEELPDAEFVGTVRHPSAVVQSLSFASNRLSLSARESLWCEYNRRLVALRRRRSFPIVCFDRDDKKLLADIESATRRLGLATSRKAKPFFDPTLRHHGDATVGSVSTEAVALYNVLRDYSLHRV